MKNRILEEIAPKGDKQLRNIRSDPALKWRALARLHATRGKEQYPLEEWSQAVSCLLGCAVCFESYAQVRDSLKPFAQGLK